MTGVDFIQSPGQGLELLGGHGGSQLTGGGGQLLNGPQSAADGTGVLEQMEDQTDQLTDQHHTGSKEKEPDRQGQIQGQGVECSISFQLDGVAGRLLMLGKKSLNQVRSAWLKIPGSIWRVQPPGNKRGQGKALVGGGTVGQGEARRLGPDLLL